MTGLRVIKLGGRVQRDARLPAALASHWSDSRGALCIVHGGRDIISALQRAAGIEPTFVGGRRVTSPDDIDILRMALSGSANKALVASLTAAGLPAVGISGEDAGLLTAEPVDGGALGAAGTVTAVHGDLIHDLLAEGYLPVVSPLAASATPRYAALNVNGDDAAAALAAALRAIELLLISDVHGVRVGGRTTATLDSAQARAALASGEIADGMAVKVQAALVALAGGVPRVRIGGLGTLIGTDEGTIVEQRTLVAVGIAAGGGVA
jgi:acetylglutamate kinase